MLARNTQAMHEIIGAAVTPFNRALQAAGPTQHWFDPTTRHGAMMLDRIINEQAQIVAYANDYVLLIMATVPGMAAASRGALATESDQHTSTLMITGMMFSPRRFGWLGMAFSRQVT